MSVSQVLCELEQQIECSYIARRWTKHNRTALLHQSMILHYIQSISSSTKSWSTRVHVLFQSFLDQSINHTINQSILGQSQIEFEASIAKYPFIEDLYHRGSDTRARTHIRAIVPYLDQIISKRQCIYALINCRTNKLYIGRSNDITRRFGEHMKAAYNHRLHGKETERVHAHMAHNHTSGWFMIPIFRCANYESDAIVCERRFIRSFNKNRLLNSEPINLKHPHLKHNSLKRNPKHRPHSKKRVRTRHVTHFDPQKLNSSKYVPQHFRVLNTSNNVVYQTYDLSFILRFLDTEPACD